MTTNFQATLAQRIETEIEGCEKATERKHAYDWNTVPPVDAIAEINGKSVEGTLYTCHMCHKKVFVPDKWRAEMNSVSGKVSVRRVEKT